MTRLQFIINTWLCASCKISYYYYIIIIIIIIITVAYLPQ